MIRQVVIDPEVMGGEPCSATTRVPVRNLWDALAAGESLDEFLDGFPTVRRGPALAVLAAGEPPAGHETSTAPRRAGLGSRTAVCQAGSSVKLA